MVIAARHGGQNLALASGVLLQRAGCQRIMAGRVVQGRVAPRLWSPTRGTVN
jgi:hypothetical protein